MYKCSWTAAERAKKNRRQNITVRGRLDKVSGCIGHDGIRMLYAAHAYARRTGGGTSNSDGRATPTNFDSVRVARSRRIFSQSLALILSKFLTDSLKSPSTVPFWQSFTLPNAALVPRF